MHDPSSWVFPLCLKVLYCIGNWNEEDRSTSYLELKSYGFRSKKNGGT